MNKHISQLLIKALKTMAETHNIVLKKPKIINSIDKDFVSLINK